MSRDIPMDRPLSESDRKYLEDRGSYPLIDRLDQEFGNISNDGEEPEDVFDGDDGDDGPDPGYEEWTAEELREELRERKLSSTGTKAEMAARLREADAASG